MNTHMIACLFSTAVILDLASIHPKWRLRSFLFVPMCLAMSRLVESTFSSSLFLIRGIPTILEPQIAATPGLFHVLEAVRGHAATNRVHTALCHVVSPPNTPPLSDPELDGPPLSNCELGLVCPGCHPSLTWSYWHRDSFRLGRWSHRLPRSAMWRVIYPGLASRRLKWIVSSTFVSGLWKPRPETS